MECYTWTIIKDNICNRRWLPVASLWAGCAVLSQKMALHLCLLLHLQGTAVPVEKYSSLLDRLGPFLSLYLNKTCFLFSLQPVTQVWLQMWATIHTKKGRWPYLVTIPWMSPPLRYSSLLFPASSVPVGGKCCSFHCCRSALKSLCRVSE